MENKKKKFLAKMRDQKAKEKKEKRGQGRSFGDKAMIKI